MDTKRLSAESILTEQLHTGGRHSSPRLPAWGPRTLPASHKLAPSAALAGRAERPTGGSQVTQLLHSPGVRRKDLVWGLMVTLLSVMVPDHTPPRTSRPLTAPPAAGPPSHCVSTRGGRCCQASKWQPQAIAQTPTREGLPGQTPLSESRNPVQTARWSWRSQGVLRGTEDDPSRLCAPPVCSRHGPAARNLSFSCGQAAILQAVVDGARSLPGRSRPHSRGDPSCPVQAPRCPAGPYSCPFPFLPPTK